MARPKPSNKKPAPPAQKRKNDKNGPAASPKRPRGVNCRRLKTVRKVETIVPEKSPNDPNDFRIIKLSNGLTAILISRKSPTGPGDQNLGPGPHLRCPSPDDEMSMDESGCCLLPDMGFQPKHHYKLETTSGRRMEMEEDVWSDDIRCHVRRPNPPSFTSVAMVVNIGSLDDPLPYEGLAHFTEHVVHHGSEEFPDEDAIDLIVGNFGFHNASTGQHTTSYYNQVPDALLYENLELFSAMLTNPLLPEDVLQREVKSVDSEFYFRLPNRHKYLLLPRVAIQNPDHPLTRFGCGNIGTLTDCAKENGNAKRMQDVMRKNHEDKYVASAMTLAINSTKSLDELEELVLDRFSQLPQGPHQVLHKIKKEAASEGLTLKNTGNTHIYIQGDSSQADLTLAWMLPASLWLDNSNEKVVPILQAMFSDTSEGSLNGYLHKEGLSWKTGAGAMTTHYATIFMAVIYLTKTGQDQVEKILSATSSFIDDLKTKSCEQQMKRFFEELKISNLRDFHYGRQYCDMNYTQETAMRLQYGRDLKKIICNESWTDAKFNYGSVKNALGLFTPDRLVKIQTVPKQMTLAQIQAREKSNEKVQQVPYSNAPYIIVRNSKSNTPPTCSNNIQKKQFSLPPANPFLKAEFDKNCGENGAGDKAGDWFLLRPANFGNISHSRLRWSSKSDRKSGDYLIPKITGLHFGHQAVSYDPYIAHIRLSFVSPFRLGTTRLRALALLWAMVISNQIHDKRSKFLMGGFCVSITPGMDVNVVGYPKYALDVLEDVLTEMFEREITPVHFQAAKEYVRVLREMHMTSFNHVSNTLVQSVLHRMPAIDILGELEQLTLTDLKNSIVAFKQSSYCVVCLDGNIPLLAFEGIAKALDKREFGPNLDIPPSKPLCSIAQPGIFKPGETCMRVRSVASASFTTTVTNLYILGPSIAGNSEQMGLFRMAMGFIDRMSFWELRTQKQLGYVVGARMQANSGLAVPVMSFAVTVVCTAKRFSPCQVDQNIDQFLAGFGDGIKAMNCDVFDMMRDKLRLPETMTQEVVGNWLNSVFGHDFAAPEHRLKCAMKGIRKVSVQVIPGNPAAKPLPCTCDRCRSISGWTSGPDLGATLQFAKGAGDYQKYFVTSSNYT